jgi:large subunit ribosomal protein L10
VKKIIQKKQVQTIELADNLKKAKSVALFNYSTMTAAQSQTIRRTLRKEKGDMVVYKNTLATRAFEQVGMSDLSSHLIGQVAIVYGYENEALPFKAVADLIKINPKVKFVGG